MSPNDGLPNLFRLSVAAEILGVQHGTLRRWADQQHILIVQVVPKGSRLVSRLEIERLASSLKITPRWEHALE